MLASGSKDQKPSGSVKFSAPGVAVVLIPSPDDHLRSGSGGGGGGSQNLSKQPSVRRRLPIKARQRVKTPNRSLKKKNIQRWKSISSARQLFFFYHADDMTDVSNRFIAPPTPLNHY